ncbi:MAG TPA: peptidase domain-containing ABC transporter [Chitinophaga sp.]|uniref:peptidase domain-containing ABC transporter n=1 Tax=Chitinophaga sp. TaxID=1869181 RepID=UPI002F91D697
MSIKRFPFYKQLNAMDCGPTCLRMIAMYYGRHYNADTLRQKAGFNKQGVSMLGISETAERIGLRSRGARITFKKLQEVPLPCILHWDQSHFVVLVEINNKRVRVADPGKGFVVYSPVEFQQHWLSTVNDEGEEAGLVLVLEVSPRFYEQEGEKQHKLSWSAVTQYLRPGKWQVAQVFLALLVTSLIQLIFPFLAQSIVDTGINTQNLHYITIVLIAQLMLTFSSSIVEFIRSRLMMRISNILNISILSDFWIKLTRLPLSYFDLRHTGDTLQRIGDHGKIQSFLTGSVLNTLFSIFNFFLYSIILVTYSTQLFFVFIIGSTLYFSWIQLFMRIRRKLNYEIFHVAAKENNATLQLVQGMQEIRMNNAEQLKRWEWENLQANIFKLNFKSLNYGQIQQIGALFLNQGKDFVITFLVAKMVVEGQLTFGTMLAVQYIIGQLNSPVSQLIGFAQGAQDARISMERLNEVHELHDEESAEKSYLHQLPDDKSITVENLSFAYPGAGNDPVLEDVSLKIEEGKVTAIVGVSGSGKTTLLKLLLKFYEQFEGELKVGANNLKYMSPSFWRSQCGAVLQDGYIFNDTIARNIAVGDEIEDYNKLITACRMAQILSFIESLPNGFYTKLGADGVGVSQGQRQRILIARAIYKDPQYLFFDEATNALDANNEKAIVENLEAFFKGRTVVVVAHRLSTVRNADNIIVLHDGKIAEEGTHAYLSALKGKYFQLVKNQLELGS